MLTTTANLLKPSVISLPAEHDKLMKQQQRQAKYYNKQAKDLPDLSVGDTVRVKPVKLGDKVWKKGVITKNLGDRSYQVSTTDGATYRRNRVHLKRTEEPTTTHNDNVTILRGTTPANKAPDKMPRQPEVVMPPAEMSENTQPPGAGSEVVPVPESQHIPEPTPHKSPVKVRQATPAKMSPKAEMNSSNQTIITRRGRAVKTPVYLKDYTT